MKLLPIMILLLLVGCGSGPVEVELHIVTREELTTIGGSPYYIGYAFWTEPPGKTLCDIYVMPEQSYDDYRQFNQVIGHELFCHCIQGIEHSLLTDECKEESDEETDALKQVK